MTTTTPTSGAAIQPVLWVSPEQFANFVDADEAPFGKYVPARKTSAGKFTMPLFAARAPADSVQEDAALQLIADLVRHIDRETCTHEETHRGGAIWEICNSCGSMWADDKGGKPEFKWPDCVEKARAFLDAARKQGEKQ